MPARRPRTDSPPKQRPRTARPHAPAGLADTPVTPKRGRGRPSSREAMLDAAQAVVLEQGAARLTLDAVAQRAGASKGGVLYNFPSKEALLRALIERVVAHNAQAHRRAIETLPDTPTRALRAYVMNSVRAPDADDQVSGALLAALAADPALLAPVRAYFSARFAEIGRKLPLEHAATVFLATEGLWLLELVGIAPFAPAQRARIVRRLLRLADEGLPD